MRFSAGFAGFGLAATLLAQMFGQDSPFRLKVDVSLIPLDVAVYDVTGQPVKNLTRDDFLVYEDGELQTVQSFETSEAPYRVLLLFDTSGSTRNQFTFLLEAANVFLRTLRPTDLIAIARFDDVVIKLQDWRPRGGPSTNVLIGSDNAGTDFYGALQWASDELIQVPGRKGVVVLTDGIDRRMTAQAWRSLEEGDFQRTLRSVEESQTPFYFIAINTDLNPHAGPASALPRIRMEQVVEHAGGGVFLPKTIEDVKPVYEHIARALGSSYSLAYPSNRPQADETYRRIEVRVRPSGMMVSQSRQGYYARAVRPPAVGTPDTPLARVSSQIPVPAALPISIPAVPAAPVLVTPIEQALLPPPETSEWRFDWEDIPNAAKYQIAVIPPNSTVPLIEAEVRSSHYVRPRGRALPSNSSGWTWRVRAQTRDGVWRGWSETRGFEVFVKETATANR